MISQQLGDIDLIANKINSLSNGTNGQLLMIPHQDPTDKLGDFGLVTGLPHKNIIEVGE